MIGRIGLEGWGRGGGGKDWREGKGRGLEIGEGEDWERIGEGGLGENWRGEVGVD